MAPRSGLGLVPFALIAFPPGHSGFSSAVLIRIRTVGRRSTEILVRRQRCKAAGLKCTVIWRTVITEEWSFFVSRNPNRVARLEARITRDALAIVRRAAEIQGRSVSDFVVAAAQEAAQKTVAEVEVIRLSREAQEKFVDLLLNPPPPNAALLRAFDRRRSLIVD